MGLLHVVTVALAVAAPPPVDAPLPATPGAYVDAIEEVRPAQRAAARAWDGERPVPEDLERYALYEQRMSYALADDPALSRKVIPRLSGRERWAVRDQVQAQRNLARLAQGLAREARVGLPHRQGRVREKALALLRPRRAALRRHALDAGRGEPARVEPQSAALQQRRRRAGPDAVHPVHLGRVRARRQRARPARRDPRRRELPARQRRARETSRTRSFTTTRPRSTWTRSSATSGGCAPSPPSASTTRARCSCAPPAEAAHA